MDQLVRPFSKNAHWHKPTDVVVVSYVLSVYRDRCKRRKIKFTISRDEFARLILSPCHYCGAKRTNNKTVRWKHRITYNGIDRVNNKLGYIPGNCVPCCLLCNYFKRGFEVDVFLGHVKSIYKWQSRNR